MILHVVDIIGRFKNKQKNRLSEYTRATCQNESNKFDDDTPMDKFYLAMDSYFTLPKVIKRLRELSVGVVGTARARKNLPSKELKLANKNDANFNDFYYCYDEHGTLLAL